MTRRPFQRTPFLAAFFAALLAVALLPACGPSSSQTGAAPAPAQVTPPAAQVTPPTAQVTPPTAQATPPAAQTTPPAAPTAATPLTAVATKEAPRLCANFINLVNRGYYDGQPWADFSRVVRQTGINAAGDPAYSLPREFGTNLFFDKPGRLCYSNNSDDVSTARSKPTRIFITVRPQDRWNLQYAVFGTIVEGLDVAMNLKDGEKIVRVQIEGDFAAHQARFSKQIAEWNAALDKVGLVERR
ncbi:MAG: peptidylprolyl isomerase [Planctomycetota bacterium]|nr:peptidylprolyl isomerase [Planctomycetota bacterium]